MTLSLSSALMAILLAVLGAPARQAAAGQQPEAAMDGAGLYKTYCASCHGRAGRGDGPMVEWLRKPPPDLTQFARHNGGLFPSERVFRIVDGREPLGGHGGPEMPVWGDAFARAKEGGDDDTVKRKIQAIVKYLDGLQERPAAD